MIVRSRTGIFSGLGDLPQQLPQLKLVPTPGTFNPFARATQRVLKEVMGASNLAVDGQWGDCSEQAWKNAYGTSPSPTSVADTFLMGTFNIPVSAVKTWGKASPQCPDNTSAITGQLPARKGFAAPVLILAKELGLPSGPAAEVCKQAGRVANLAEGTCECPSGTFEDVNTLECTQFEQPPSNRPPTIRPVLIKVMPSLALVQAGKIAPVSQSFKPSGGGGAISQVKSGGTAALAVKPLTTGGRAITSTSGVALAAVGVVGVLAIVVGGWYFLLRDAPVAEVVGDTAFAVPNRRRRRRRRMRCNCGE